LEGKCAAALRMKHLIKPIPCRSQSIAGEKMMKDDSGFLQAMSCVKNDLRTSQGLIFHRMLSR
jgi:hypothetical protein